MLPINFKIKILNYLLYILICASTGKDSSGKREFIFTPLSASAPKESINQILDAKTYFLVKKYLLEKQTKKKFHLKNFPLIAFNSELI